VNGGEVVSTNGNIITIKWLQAGNGNIIAYKETATTLTSRTLNVNIIAPPNDIYAQQISTTTWRFSPVGGTSACWNWTFENVGAYQIVNRYSDGSVIVEFVTPPTSGAKMCLITCPIDCQPNRYFCATFVF
jgi:uncharacterized protein (DUF427 family)